MANSKDNLSTVLHKIDDLRLEQVPLPKKPANNEVLLRAKCVRICGSDAHYWETRGDWKFHTWRPNNIRTRNMCWSGGRWSRCETLESWWQSLYIPPKSWNLTKFFLHPADYAFKTPDKLSEEEGAMIEPLTVAVYACKKSKVSVSKDVLITGAGPIGLFNTMVAKAL